MSEPITPDSQRSSDNRWHEQAERSLEAMYQRALAAEATVGRLEKVLDQILATWDDPAPASRMDVRYQDVIRLARAARSTP